MIFQRSVLLEECGSKKTHGYSHIVYHVKILTKYLEVNLNSFDHHLEC